MRVTKWIATFVGGLIRFPKENNALSARNIAASLTFQAAYDERRNRAATVESTLDEDRWIITPSRRTRFHKSHYKERKGGHWERGSDARRTTGLKANKKTTVSMSGCCGVIHNMQQTSFHVLKNPNKCSQWFCRRKQTRSFGVKHTEKWTENVHCCVWLLMMMAEYEQVVSRWEWLKTDCSVSLCAVQSTTFHLCHMLFLFCHYSPLIIYFLTSFILNQHSLPQTSHRLWLAGGARGRVSASLRSNQRTPC